MKLIIQKTVWLIFITIWLTSCSKDKENCDPDDEESPCYAGVGKTNGECWYSITIDGATTLPNTFGQDKMVLGYGIGEDKKGAFHFDISQAKSNSANNALFTMAGHALLNSKLPKGSYPGMAFQTMPFNSGDFSAFPLYTHVVGDDLPNFTIDVLENSAQQLRLKMSGMAKVLDINSPEAERIAQVTMEMKIGRKYFNEIMQDGELVGGALCDCK